MDLTLSPDERSLLVRLLESALGETRVEVHRTHYSPTYRDEVQSEEKLIRALLQRVQGNPVMPVVNRGQGI